MYPIPENFLYSTSPNVIKIQKRSGSAIWIYIYIYIYIIIIIIRSLWQHQFLGLSLTILPYHMQLLEGLINCIKYLHRTDVRKSFLVGQHWHDHVLESEREYRFKFLKVLIGWSERWEASSRRAMVFWDVATSISLKTAFLYNFYQTWRNGRLDKFDKLRKNKWKSG